MTLRHVSTLYFNSQPD